LSPGPEDLAGPLLAVERRLDPADPARGGSGAEVLGYGEVSAVLAHPALPGLALKRMSGFPSRAAVEDYAGVVARYLELLGALDVPLVETALVPLEPAPRRHVVYLVQPRLDPRGLTSHVLRCGSLAALAPLLEQVLGHVHRVLGANAARRDGREVAVDAQLSNWVDPGDGRLRLLDVGTPFLRKDGALEMGTDLFLRPYPAPARWYLRRHGDVERYIDAFFGFRTTVIDLLGNFFKEGAPEKLPGAIELVNAWCARQPDAGRLGAVDEAAVRAYYARDASTLELSLRLRRLQRFVTARLLRRRYDFVLPGRIAR
jgi:hypothetical protein